jgi:hypothetical protein
MTAPPPHANSSSKEAIMREHMEPLRVVTSIDIHLADEGRVTYQVHPAQRRAVIALETTAASVALDVRSCR